MLLKMKNLIFFSFIMIVFAEDEGHVSFSGTDVTIRCYGETDLKKDKESIASDNPQTETYLDNVTESYSCYDGQRKHLSFYIKAKVCENCYELDILLIISALLADLLITGGIITIIYVFGQKKAGTAPQKPSNVRRNVNPSAPPVPSPDYQPLSDFTRSKDTYATVHKTG